MRELTSNDIWKTKDGKEVAIKDMEDSHLLNCIRLLNRKIEECPNQYGYPCFQGEMAQECAEQEFEHNEEILEYLIKWSEAMEEEARNRNLEGATQ